VALHLLEELGKGSKIDNINLIHNWIMDNYRVHLKEFHQVWKKFRVLLHEA
jgi:hypothetical protein